MSEGTPYNYVGGAPSDSQPAQAPLVAEALTYEQAHEIAVKRLLGEITGPWSPAEARWHAEQFIAKNSADNLVRLLAERYLELARQLEQAEEERDHARERWTAWQEEAHQCSRALLQAEREKERLTMRGGIARSLMTARQVERFHAICAEREQNTKPSGEVGEEA